MINFRQLWFTFIVTLIPAAAQAGSAETWKDHQAGRDPMAEFLTIAGIIIGGIVLLWILSKAQGFIDKKGEKTKSKKK